MKACSTCKIEKYFSCFTPQKKGADGLRSICKTCTNFEQRRRYAANPEAHKRYRKNNRHLTYEARRRRSLKVLYGVTPEWYEATLMKQNGRCAVCGSDKPAAKRQKTFHIDHCHTTGQVRGLLCNSCNNGLGRFKHEPELLQKAITYLNY